MNKNSFHWRIASLLVLFFVLFSLVIYRLFYWQVLASEELSELAKNQYYSQIEIPPSRGEIFASDSFPLVINKEAYLLYASRPQLKKPPAEIAKELAPLLAPDPTKEATDPAQRKTKAELIESEELSLEEKLGWEELVWIILKHKLSPEVREQIESLAIEGLGFSEEPIRFYPEASMAAHLSGFVGKNEAGRDTGYFGLEGFYDLELRGRQGLLTQETDAGNDPILIGSFSNQEKKDGQSLILHLNRSVQFLVEEKLKQALEKYEAKSGSVVVMNPQTGGIVALAAEPSFSQETYFQFEKEVFKNPVISDAYEPGSTFKIFVMAAALDRGLVEPETKCDLCSGPIKIDKYTIRTWNDEYHPDSTMREVIQHSDNTGMVFVAQKFSRDQFWQFLEDFGFGEKTGIDLQGEIASSLRPKKDWSQVDLATAAFGQGIAVTAIQMVRAGAVIANGGQLVEPQVVKEIISGEERIGIQPRPVGRVIKPATAQIVKEMMVQAVEKGEAKWLKLPGYQVAGKTGTAQIPVAGHYDQEKTIASFIGFAPADEPRFVMLVKLREPQSSPWGSETAAPLFFSIAKELLVYYGVQPD